MVANSAPHQIQTCFSYFKAMHTETPPPVSRLLIRYRPSRVLMSSFSARFLQVPRTNRIFSVPALSTQLPQLFRYPSRTQSVHPTHPTLSGGTIKHLFRAAFSNNNCIAARKVATPLRETRMPHGIRQCYLPPSRGDIPALTPAEAGTRLSDPGGMQG